MQQFDSYCKKHNIDISNQKSTAVRREDLTYFDTIIALDESNKRDLEKMGAKNVMKLGAFGYAGEDVPDPYHYSGLEGFEKVYQMIENCVENLLDGYNP
jgi:protein-tyrosine phosphatase